MKVELSDVVIRGAGDRAACELFCTELEGPQQATVAAWWLECPGEAPLWSKYLLAVVHLRPVDGIPANVVVPGATHELLVVALNPERDPRAVDPDSWEYLLPPNVTEQVELPDDNAAKQLASHAAQAVVAGILWAEPPLSGQVEPWRTSLIKTAAHLRGEPHAP